MAKNVQVLLRDDISALGRCGDVVKVTPGYARNFLFPHNLATHANAENVKLMARRRAKLDAQIAVHKAQIEARVATLATVSVSIKEKADENGHLFGSVNAPAIVRLLEKAGHIVAEKDVRLEAPIKVLGSFQVPVHVHGDLTALITVVVEAG